MSDYDSKSRHIIGLIFAVFDRDEVTKFYEQLRKKLFDLK